MSRMDHLTDTVLAGIAAQRQAAEVFDEMGMRIPVPIFLLLARLAKTRQGELCVKTIAAGFLASNASYGLEKMRRIGLVDLTSSDDDARRRIVRITDKGRWAIRRFEELLEKSVHQDAAA